MQNEWDLIDKWNCHQCLSKQEESVSHEEKITFCPPIIHKYIENHIGSVIDEYDNGERKGEQHQIDQPPKESILSKSSIEFSHIFSCLDKVFFYLFDVFSKVRKDIFRMLDVILNLIVSALEKVFFVSILVSLLKLLPPFPVLFIPKTLLVFLNI